MKKIIYFILFILLVSFTIVDKVEKKCNKILAKTFKEIMLMKTRLDVSSKNEDEKWHKISDKALNRKLGYLETTSAIGRFDKFDFMVLFNPDKSIKKVRVLIYREDHGGEIGNKRWLKQFEGKSLKDVKTLNSQINGISGATMSCNSITNEIKKSLITIQKVK